MNNNKKWIKIVKFYENISIIFVKLFYKILIQELSNDTLKSDVFEVN